MTRTEPTAEYEFRCPRCAERIRINGAMRETIRADGCVLCGARVSSGDIEHVE